MISLIATVLNEGESIHRLMGSLVAQTRLPDEIVMVDGGSRDDTVAIIQGYVDRLPLRVLIEPGCNISEGRNRAIAAAKGDIIAVTDAGVELAVDWLEKITRPLIEDATCLFVGGFFTADYTNLFELAMSATVLPLAEEIHPATFLPTSRSVAFRKVAWQAVEGYPEWLDYCEDLVFDLRVKRWMGEAGSEEPLPQPSPVYRGGSKTSSNPHPPRSLRSQPSPASEGGGKGQDTSGNPHPPAPSPLRERGGEKTNSFVFVPEAVVAFRPRGSLRRFFKQYYLYARGDGKADLWRKRHAARYLTYLVALPVVFLLGVVIHPLLWLLVLPGGYVYLRQPYRRLGKMVQSGNPHPPRSLRSQPSPLRERGGAETNLSMESDGLLDTGGEPLPQPSPVYRGGSKRQEGQRKYTAGEMVYLGVMVLVIRVVGDVAKMVGYPVGWWWRLREHPPDWSVITVS